MKKFMNDVGTILIESLDGLAEAHADILTLGDEHKFVRRKALKPGKVALVSGGGSGHEPLHAGLVDEIRLVLSPVALGAGKPALPTDLRLDLELIDERRFGNGAMHVAYRVRI